jgi:hypothetical protein
VKKIIANLTQNSASITPSPHTTLYHRFPRTDQQSRIANQKTATAMLANITTFKSM